MPFWKTLSTFLFREQLTRQQNYESIIQTISQARQALNNMVQEPLPAPVTELLALFWQEDIITLVLARAGIVQLYPQPGSLLLGRMNREAIHRHFTADLLRMTAASPQVLLKLKSTEAHYMRELVGFIRQEASQCPTDIRQRKEAVLAGIRHSLRHNMRELRLTDEIFPLHYLKDSLAIGCALNDRNLEDVLCELLVSTHKVIVTERDGARIAPVQTFQREVRDLLRRLPPEQTPTLWRHAQRPANFTSVLACSRFDQ